MERNDVPGLTTPQLNGGEITAQSNNLIKDEEELTLYDLTQEIESKFKGILEELDANDAEFTKRVDSLTSKITALESSLLNEEE